MHERIKALIRTRDALREQYQDISLDRSITPVGPDKKFLNDFRVLVEKILIIQNLMLKKLAPELGMSRVQVYRKVKALLNCTVNDYVINARLKRAQYLLLSTDKSVAEIASEVGFSAPDYFLATFKARLNLTPKEFE